MRAEYSVTEVSWATHQQQLMALRFAVFVGEQGIAAEDERDPTTQNAGTLWRCTTTLLLLVAAV